MSIAMPVVVVWSLACRLPAEDAPRTGIFQLTFTERSPESDYVHAQIRNPEWPAVPPTDGNSVYDLAKEPFDVNVPATYDGTVPFGLIVHIDSGKTGNPYVYKDLMGPHHLIWVGSATSDNDRGIPIRVGLALDAVWNMTKRYRIDPKRIYICGLSGGSKCASKIAVTYSDIITGGAIYMVGCLKFQIPDERKLGVQLLEPALDHRFVFMTGANDFNRPETLDTLEFYKGSNFKYTELIDTPGMGHEFPPQEAFSRAIDFLDAPLMDEAAQVLAQAQQLELQGKLLNAYAAYQSAATDFPLAVDVIKQATPKLTELNARIDQQLQPELARLTSSSPPNADRIRIFAAKYTAFPVSAAAKAKAEELSGKQVDAIIASAGSGEAGRLEKFMVLWKGYDSAARALTAYDALAATAATPVEAITDSTRRDHARVKFINRWAICPTVETMRLALDHDLAPKLAVLKGMATSNEKAEGLHALARDWKGTDSAAQAAAALDAMIAAAPDTSK